MISFFVDSQVLNAGIVSIEINENVKSKRIPHENVSFLTTTCDKSTLLRVDERIDWLLVNVESLIIFVIQVFDIMNMDETVD